MDLKFKLIVYFGIIIAFFLPSIISYIGIKTISLKGTDQYYHNLLLKTIRKNGNRFVTVLPNLMGKNYVAYPQFLHWILSYFTKTDIEKLARFTVPLFHLLSALSLAFFVVNIHPYVLEAGYQIGIERFLLTTGIIYAMNPYHYDLINAKNSGLSARGLGLFFGQTYLYVLVLNHLEPNNYYFLLALCLLSFFIFISSTFTLQFLFISLPFFIYFYGNSFLVIPLLFGASLYYIITPKVFLTFFQGQYVHKKIWSTFQAKRTILRERHSIIRDFFYDFWVLIFNKEKSFFSKIKYISTNSIFSAIINMPSVIYMFYLWKNSSLLLFEPNLFWLTSIPILVCFIVFFATLFRATRFLGEPERYLEFAIGLAASMIAIYYRDNPWIIQSILALSLIFIFFRVWMYKMALAKANGLKIRLELEEMNRILLEKSNNRDERLPKVLSNNMYNANMFMSDKSIVFRFYPTQKGIANFTYEKLFKNSMNIIEESYLIPIIKSFGIDYFVYEKGTINNLSSIINHPEFDFELIRDAELAQLYRVCPKHLLATS